MTPLLSVVIPNWNGRQFLPTCLDSLEKQSYTPIEMILVDNASDDDSVQFVQTQYPDVQVIQLQENKGFTGACNAGMKVARGEFIALLNNDTELDFEWAREVISAFLRHPEVGIVASKMLLFNDREHFHNAGDYFTTDGRPGNRGVWQRDEGQYDEEEFVFSACGGASTYRKKMLDEIGLLDDDFFFSMEDIDLSWRAQLSGWRALYTPKAIVYHHLSATGGGATASYYDGRNSIILLVKNLPGDLWKKYRRQILARQWQIFWEALRAWRGEAARAHIRGILQGVISIPGTLRKRRSIQQNRKVSIEYLDSILTSPQDQSNRITTERTT